MLQDDLLGTDVSRNMRDLIEEAPVEQDRVALDVLPEWYDYGPSSNRVGLDHAIYRGDREERLIREYQQDGAGIGTDGTQPRSER